VDCSRVNGSLKMIGSLILLFSKFRRRHDRDRHGDNDVLDRFVRRTTLDPLVTSIANTERCGRAQIYLWSSQKRRNALVVEWYPFVCFHARLHCERSTVKLQLHQVCSCMMRISKIHDGTRHPCSRHAASTPNSERLFSQSTRLLEIRFTLLPLDDLVAMLHAAVSSSTRHVWHVP
jgi:hypothetical protein